MTDEPFDSVINPFDESDPRYDAWNYRHTDFREPALRAVKDYGARLDTYRAFDIYINDLMSDNAFMSNQSPPKKSLANTVFGTGEQVSYNQYDKTMNHLEICRELLLVSVDPMDLKRNWVYHLINEIENHTYNFTMTRTVGDKREGLENRVIQSKTTSEIKQWEASEKEKTDKKRGGWI